jgi:hypothetical protein
MGALPKICHFLLLRPPKTQQEMITCMKYQLILQWPASSIKDYGKMIEIEEAVIKALGNFGKVDGHDAGSGEMNIFIFTDHPKLAFERLAPVLGKKDSMPDLKVAYREVGKGEYTILYPADLTSFAIV